MALPSNALCSVADVREYLHIPDTDPPDSTLEALIAHASNVIETYVGTNIINEQHTDYYDGDGSYYLTPDHYPIVSVSTFQIDGEDVGTEDTDYYVYRTYIYVVGGLPEGHKNVKLVYTSGWGADMDSIPNDFVLACLKLVNYWYRKDVAAYSDTYGEPEEIRRLPSWPLPAAVKNLVSPYRAPRTGGESGCT